MPKALASFLITVFSLVQPIFAGEWSTIPAEVWAIKEDPAKGLKGALVLEDRISFKGNCIEYRYRVRIFAESGQSAAEFNQFPNLAEGFDGRTVYPDGKIVKFSKRTDFASKSITAGDLREKRTVVIAPGVTNDCVVELLWREPAAEMGKWSPLPERFGNSFFTQLANPFPTKEFTIEVVNNCQFFYTYFPTRTLRPETTTNGRMKIFTFRDIPAKEPIPFGFDQARDFPAFTMFYVPEELKISAIEGGKNFWSNAANYYFKRNLKTEVKKGRDYRNLFEELCKDVVGSATEQAAEIKIRMDAKIRNLSDLTIAEKGNLKREEKGEINSHLLDETAQRGSTDGYGMVVLYLHLLQDKGLQPQLALVANKRSHLLRFNCPNILQFDSYLMGLPDDKGDMFWIEPARRFSIPGIVHPNYQDTQAIQINPKDWAASLITIPAQPISINERKYSVEVIPGDSADRFTLKASFKGYPEYVERARYSDFEQREQNNRLKEYLEEWHKSGTIAKTEVKGTQDSKQLVSWSAEGSIEREEARQREVQPFPGIPTALYIPDEWPEARRDLIHIPFHVTQENTSIIHIPEGWTWNGAEPYRYENHFGLVFWNAEKQGNNTIKVVLRIEVDNHLTPASSYTALKTYLGWIKEASNRVVILQKS